MKWTDAYGKQHHDMGTCYCGEHHALDNQRRMEERLRAAEAEVARLRDGLREIAGKTPTSHRREIDQLRDAVKWRQGIARDLLADQDGEGRRCPAIHPRSTERDQCQRPLGHEGDHLGVSHSGTIKIYPSKWADQDGAAQTYTCPCGYPGPEPCNGCPDGCKRRPAGVTGWDHIDKPRGGAA